MSAKALSNITTITTINRSIIHKEYSDEDRDGNREPWTAERTEAYRIVIEINSRQPTTVSIS